MTEQDPRVEEWKEKFFKVSDALEKQQDYDSTAGAESESPCPDLTGT